MMVWVGVFGEEWWGLPHLSSASAFRLLQMIMSRPSGIREAIECASIIVWALSRSELLNVELLLNNHR